MAMSPVEALPPDEEGPNTGSEEDRRELRQRVLDHLRYQGFTIANDRLITPVLNDKERIRAIHAEAVASSRAKAAAALRRNEDLFVRKLGTPEKIDVTRIDPVLVPIASHREFNAYLWRWCALHWSIPVSGGYGRRLRFLVLDRGNGNNVMGLFGLADPVFALASRDAWIGWDAGTRGQRLANVMDAFVLGAVPPYSSLRAGKLVALLTTSSEVVYAFAERYGHRKTLISQRDPNANLALVTTTSALGRSSIYNRLTGPDGRLAFLPVGYTGGSGDFHLSGAIYADLVRFATSINKAGDSHAHPRWKGHGPRNRREVIQRALQGLDLDGRALRVHGIRRQVYVAPTMHNTRDYLARGAKPVPRDYSLTDLAGYWLTRWALPRARRDDTWQSFEPNLWRLYTPHPGMSDG